MLRAFAIALALTACGNKSAPPTTEPTGGTGGTSQSQPCIKTGCSGTICTEPGNEQMSTCEYKPEYACYKEAACVRRKDASCGWFEDDGKLKACLANPPKQAPQPQ
jgi:hypothetical protein